MTKRTKVTNKINGKETFMGKQNKVRQKQIEFDLSEKIIEAKDPSLTAEVLFVEDVKEFIKEVKEYLNKEVLLSRILTNKIINRIDNLVGDKLK